MVKRALEYVLPGVPPAAPDQLDYELCTKACFPLPRRHMASLCHVHKYSDFLNGWSLVFVYLDCC